MSLRAGSRDAAPSGRPAPASSQSKPAARPPDSRQPQSAADPDGHHSAMDPLDILAERELFPDGRPSETSTAPAAAPSWTLAEEASPSLVRHPPAPPDVWPPVVDEEEEAAAAAVVERWRLAESYLEPAPGQWRLEPEPDEPLGAVRPLHTSVGVGRVSRLDGLVTSLQLRYRRVLETLERDSLTRPPADELRLSLVPLVPTDAPPETPGREHLHFARTCLEQLNMTLLTGPFNYHPELEEPADLLRGALRQLVSTAAALHHELELRSMAHSRHWLLLEGLHKMLQLQYQQKMAEAVTEVRAQRQLSMGRLSGQIEVNMALVQKLSQYVAQAERLSAGRGHVQSTYVQLVELTNMKRQEALMYRALLIDTSEHKVQLRSQMKTMRRSMAELLSSDSLHELLSAEYSQAAEVEMMVLQDDVTQTQAKTEQTKKQLRRVVLRKNKAVQLDRRLRQRTESLVKKLRRLDVLTTDSEQSMEDRFRSYGTLTQCRSEVHVKVQTTRISVRNAMHTLDDHLLKQLEMEGEAAEMDIGPLIREVQILEEELKSVKKKQLEARGRHADLRRRRQSMKASRHKKRVAVADTMNCISGALKDMENMEADHQTVMTLLKEQLELATEMLRMSRQKWAEINRIQGIVDLDLATLKAKGGALYNTLVARQEETTGILTDIRTLTEGALEVWEMLQENMEEEVDILQHLQVVVAELKDGRQPALQKAHAWLDGLSSQTRLLHELKNRQTAQLAAQRTRTTERARQAAELQRQVQEMEVRKRHQEEERAALIEQRRLKTQEITDYRSKVQRTQSSYAELSQRLSQEQLEQEQRIVMLRSWCRQVALCNGGYDIEISRMERELKAFYEQLERNVGQEIELSRRKMEEAETELLRLTELHNQKHAASLERDWQLRAALLASSQAAERSLKPVQKAMAGLDVERRKLVKMVATAVNMRPFSQVEIKIEQPVCQLPKDEG